MFSEPSARHHLPHFHAYYQDHSAIITIEPVGLVAGYLPVKQLKLVEAWAIIHQDELQEAWSRLSSGKSPEPIPPLH
jgi:hypothetical protein